MSLVDVGSGATRQRSNHAQGEREDDERTPGGNLPMVIVIGDPGLSRCTRETNALAAEIVQLRRSYGPAGAELTARQTCRHSTDQSFHVFAPGHFGVRADQRAGPGCVDGCGDGNYSAQLPGKIGIVDLGARLSRSPAVVVRDPSTTIQRNRGRVPQVPPASEGML